MRRIVLTLAVVFLALSSVPAWAQETETATLQRVPAASRSQAECSGFIAEVPQPSDLFVAGGADDDFRSKVRQFVEGESVFLSQPKGEAVTMGAVYRVIRPATELFTTMHYSDEGSEIRKTGKPYQDIARVQVTHLTPQGAVARVAFSCAPILPGDSLIPYQPRPIPDYVVTKPLDPFTPLDSNKQHGRIIASHNNLGNFGDGTVIYVNLGERGGLVSGRRLRIYKNLPPVSIGYGTKQQTPYETVGEAVVLSLESGTCVAMVVSSYRDIDAGDYVEVED